MQRFELASYDDLEWLESRERVRADRTVRLRLDGQDVELELTGEHYDELAGFLARYLKAGRSARDTVGPQLPRGTEVIARRQIGVAMRKFADRNAAEHPEWSYRKMEGGSYTYAKALRVAFAAHTAAATAAGGGSPVS